MATTDEMIRFAGQMAKGLRDVSRNEWMRWVQVTKQYEYDLNKALHYAQRLTQDPTIRPAPKRAYRLIAAVIQEYKNYIKQLSPDEQLRLYGYVAWHLVIYSR